MSLFIQRETLAHDSVVIGLRVLAFKKTQFCSLSEFCGVYTYKTERRAFTQCFFGFALPKVFAVRSLSEKRSSYRFESEASRKVFSSERLNAGLFQKEKYRRQEIQKKNANNTLSGEVFKERFTDIFQTSLEQVGFSLELNNKKSSKGCTATIWKKLQNGTNRRLPYFPPLSFSFFLSFPATKVLQSFEKKHQKRLCSTKLVPYQKYGGRSDTKSNDIKLTIKIGDYFSSGDKIGEKALCKKKVLYKNKSLFTHSPKLCKQKDLFANANKALFCLQTKPLTNGTPLGQGSKKPNFSNGRHTKLLTSTNLREQSEASPSGTYVSRFVLVRRSLTSSKALQTRLTSINGTLLGQRFVSNGVYKVSTSLREQSKDLYERRVRTTITPSCKTHSGFRVKTLSQKRTRCQNISTPIVLGSSGRIVTISKKQVIIQKTQPVLFYKSANLHIKKGSWVKQGAPILTLTHQTLITGDIVQGIPRIEQLFEAFTSPPPAFKDKGDFIKFKDGYNTLHSQVRDIFRNNWLNNRLPVAVRKSLEEIGYILVEMIQKVYLSQGVLIADKHIEIIVRQIASKGQILDSGTTGLFLEEVLPIRQIENANITTPGKKCLYVPAVMGLTAAALNSDSFISAASFQETTRVLSRDAVVGKSDFLRGLKEKVVIGDLISAGTGLDLYFIYTTMLTS